VSSFLAPIASSHSHEMGATRIMSAQSFAWMLRSLCAALIGLFVFSAFAQQASATVAWRDACTGQAVLIRTGQLLVVPGGVFPSTDIEPSFYPISPDPNYPNRAFIPQTGQNLVRDASGVWHDAATGQAVLIRTGQFLIVAGGVFPSTDIEPSFYPISPDPSDPNRAFIPQTGQNLILAPQTAQPMPPQIGMVPAVGLCQPLSPVAAGIHGTVHSTPVRLVIQDSTDYATFFGGTPPTTPTIDFTKQDLIAVGMGNEPSGGYSIGVNRVEVRTSGFTAGFGYVYVGQHTPIPGVTYSPNPTQPFQVIALPKGASVYNFVDEPIAGGFQQIEMHITNTTTHKDSTLTLNSNGSYVFEPINGIPFRGMATSAEVQAVSAAVIAGHLGTVPSNIPDPRSPRGTTVFSMEVDAGQYDYHIHSAIDYFGSYGTQVQPLVNSLQAIETRIQGPVPFSSITYWTGGGLTPYTETVTVDSAGKTIVTHAVGVGGTNYTGIASPSQLRVLGDAVANAGVATLPDYPITDPNAPAASVLGSEAFRSTVNGATYTTTVASSGFYGAFSPQVKPLVDAFRDVAESVIGATAGTPITGLVVYNPGTTTPPTGTSLAVGANYIDPSDPFFQLFSTLNGKTVTIDANVVGARAYVIDVQGTMANADTMRAFPSPLGTASLGVAAGAVVAVRDVSVPTPTFYESSTALASEGYVAAASVKLGNDVSAPPPVSVPNVVGLSHAAAVTALNGAGLTLGTVTLASSATVPAGSEISQTPAAGATAAPGTRVNLTESTGPATVIVPNVVGLTQAAAVTALTGAGLTFGTVTLASSPTVQAGNEISQNPAAGTSVAPGTAVNVTESTGPAATVPGPPTGVTATAGVGSAIVFWTGPLSNGGSPITSYTITPHIGATPLPSTTVSGTPPHTTTTVSGLTTGTIYTFTVSATNAVGTGPVSLPSNPVTP
jgi:hypothetical protein